MRPPIRAIHINPSYIYARFLDDSLSGFSDRAAGAPHAPNSRVTGLQCLSEFRAVCPDVNLSIKLSVGRTGFRPDSVVFFPRLESRVANPHEGTHGSESTHFPLFPNARWHPRASPRPRSRAATTPRPFSLADSSANLPIASSACDNPTGITPVASRCRI